MATTQFRSKFTLQEGKHIQAKRFQKGSSAVFFGFFMPVMLMMIVLIADIGQLIFERIRLQETVDASALAAANIQSIGMNEIADLNRDALLEYQKFTTIMTSGIWNDSGQANAAVQFYARVFDAIHRYQDQANRIFAREAHNYAREYVQKNLPGAELSIVGNSSVNQLISYQTEQLPVTWIYYASGCSHCGSPVLYWRPPDNPAVIGAHDGRIFAGNARTAPVPGFKSQKVRRIKRTPPVTYAAYALKQRPKGFILGNRLFEAIIPEMVAYSSAKPTRGHIYNMDPSYRPILKHLQRHAPFPSIPDLDKMEH